MKHILGSVFIVALVLAGCKGDEGKTLNEGKKFYNDSISRIEQAHKADSLRRTNPLLIVPPDSAYTGDYTDKYPNGIIKFRGNFRFGQRHGQWMSYFPNGLAWSELHYDKGLRHGPNIVYSQNGTLVYTGFYKNDLKDSIWCYYDSVGVMAQKLVFKNDRFVKELPTK